MIAIVCVYARSAERGPVPDGVDIMTPATVQSVFASDPQRRRVFEHFLRASCTGVVRAQDGEWVSYGWMVSPTSKPVAHLGRFCRNNWWIFYCHTGENYRRRGYYRDTLTALLRLTDMGPDGEATRVYIDVLSGNLPSRLAVQQMGFQAHGVVVAFRVRSRVVPLWWFRNARHPALPQHLVDRSSPEQEET